MQYANIITEEIKSDLASTIVLNGSTITGATIDHWRAQGWRTVTAVEQPADGYRAAGYSVVPVDDISCRLALTGIVNIATEAAAATAAALAAQKAGAGGILDGASGDVQRALVAFATLTLQEINTLRTKAGLANYTWSQFVTALKAKIDAQT